MKALAIRLQKQRAAERRKQVLHILDFFGRDRIVPLINLY